MNPKLKLMWKTILQSVVMYGILAKAALVHAEDTKIPNPLGPETTTFEKLIANVLANITPLVFTFAVVAIIIVGFKFVVAAVSGNEAEYKTAKKTLVWVLIGAAIAVGASAIAGAVVKFAGELSQ